MTSESSASKAAEEELVTLYCDAWNEPDAAKRAALLERIWDEKGTYTDPSAHAEGRRALSEHIGKVLERYAGARIERTSAADVHHGLVRFTWRMVLPGGKTLPEGTDFGEISGGRLRRIVGFFGPPAAKKGG